MLCYEIWGKLVNVFHTRSTDTIHAKTEAVVLINTHPPQDDTQSLINGINELVTGYRKESLTLSRKGNFSTKNNFGANLSWVADKLYRLHVNDRDITRKTGK